eukprot:m.355667 g.355667  ORF g.355667 m.355667 type:complete len:326 (-) comp17302_c0_seq1:418-1395(-)
MWKTLLKVGQVGKPSSWAQGARRVAMLATGTGLSAVAVWQLSTLFSSKPMDMVYASEGVEEPPALPLTLKQALGSQSIHEADLVLYQYQPCPFCTKVRTYLDYYKVPYKKVEVEPLRKPEIKFSSYKKVPILVVNGTQFNDSTEIVAALDSELQDEHMANITSVKEKEVCDLVDNRVIRLLPPNIYRTPKESMQSFDYLLDSSYNFSDTQRFFARYSGAIIMYLLCRFKLNKKYGVTDPRENLYEVVDSIMDKLQGNWFLSGTYKPGVADLALFGALRSMEGLDTLTDVLENTKVGTWYERTGAAVGLSSGVYVNAEEVAPKPST